PANPPPAEKPPGRSPRAGGGAAGPNVPGAPGIFQLLKRLKPRDVDQQGRAREPQIQHRSQRLPARQNLGALRARHGGQCLPNVGGTHIVEARSLHGFSTRGWVDDFVRSIASSSRRGVSGVSVSSTPSGRKASLTALKITAGGAIAPPSPMPLMPNSV